MGGYGSGRWGWHSKKDTVEECRSLDANRWMREGILRENLHTWGGWNWLNYAGEKTSSIGYEVDTTNSAFPWVRLFYTFTNRNESLDYKIELATTRPNFGGRRWWFICPLVINGRACNRRIGKLYLPPGRRYYGCRQCHDLTYKSCQESDKRVSWLRRNPEALLALVKNPQNLDGSGLILALKAIRW